MNAASSFLSQSTWPATTPHDSGKAGRYHTCSPPQIFDAFCCSLVQCHMHRLAQQHGSLAGQLKRPCSLPHFGSLPISAPARAFGQTPAEGSPRRLLQLFAAPAGFERACTSQPRSVPGRAALGTRRWALASLRVCYLYSSGIGASILLPFMPVARWLGFERQFSQRDIKLHVACALPMAGPKSLPTRLLDANLWPRLASALPAIPALIRRIKVCAPQTSHVGAAQAVRAREWCHKPEL